MIATHEYAPYHLLDAFEEGRIAYRKGQYCNPYGHNSVDAQAWDRGAEYSMRTAREAGRSLMQVLATAAPSPKPTTKKSRSKRSR